MLEAKLKPIHYHDPLTDSARVIRWDWEGDPNSVIAIDPRMLERIKDELPYDLIVIDNSNPFRTVLARKDAGLWPIYYLYQHWCLRRVADYDLFCSRVVLTLAVWGLATVEPGCYLGWNCVDRSTKIGVAVLVLFAVGLWMARNAVRG